MGRPTCCTKREKNSIKAPNNVYFRNEHGGISEINEFGNCHTYHEFKSIDDLLTQVVRAQMDKRTKKHDESNNESD